MFYFLYGDTLLPLKYDELLKEIKEKTPNITVKIFDISQNEEEKFIEALSINSMFVEKELIVLKRAEKMKKLDTLLKLIQDYDLSKKDIIITFDEGVDIYGRAIKTVGKKVLNNAGQLGKIIEAKKVNERKSIEFYIEKELKISERDAVKLAEVLGDDYIRVKNEIEKIKSFLVEDEFSLEKVNPILSLSEEQNLSSLIEEFLKTKNYSELIKYLEKSGEFMLFCHLICEEILVILKLQAFCEENHFFKNISYNEFKSKIYPNLKRYFKKVGGYIKEYPIFLKLQYLELYDKDFLLEKIEQLLSLDYKIKNGKIDEKMAIEQFILKFKT